MKRNGFTVVELMIVVAIVGIIASVVSSGLLNTRGATEDRAYQGATKFIDDNNIAVLRKTCAGDSDGDGYGTCTIVQAVRQADGSVAEGSKIRLECPTNWFDRLTGAVSCKEIDLIVRGGSGVVTQAN